MVTRRNVQKSLPLLDGFHADGYATSEGIGKMNSPIRAC